MLAEVTRIRPGAPRTDVAGMLRELADIVESGRYGEVCELIVVRSDRETGVAVHGYGELGGIDAALRLLVLGQAEMIRILQNSGRATRT